jgi:hypothetical protein
MQAVTGTSVRAVCAPRSVDARTTAVASAPVRNLAAARGAAVFRGSSARVASSVRAAAPTMGASRKTTTCGSNGKVRAALPDGFFGSSRRGMRRTRLCEWIEHVVVLASVTIPFAHTGRHLHGNVRAARDRHPVSVRPNNRRSCPRPFHLRSCRPV